MSNDNIIVEVEPGETVTIRVRGKKAPKPPDPKWPNEPPGLTPITDLWKMTDPLPPQTNPADDGPIPNAQDWRIAHNWPTGHIWSAADPITAEFYGTPSGWTELAGDCYQMVYPKGMRLGTAPSTIYHAVPNYWQLYFATWWKVSDPFDYSTNGTKLLFMFNAKGGQSFLTMAPDGLLMMMPEYPPVDHQYRLRPSNIHQTVVTRNQWHLVEWWLQSPPTPTTPGRTKWWLDGLLQGDWSDILNERASPFVEAQFSPTFGGNGDSYKTETDSYWFKNCHLSGAL